jgi:hypothetical protein
MPIESRLESWLVLHTSLGAGTAPERKTFVIDTNTGKARPKERLRRHLGEVQFPPEWIAEIHKLLMSLANIRTRAPEQEWRDLVSFFREAGYVPSTGASWPTKRIDNVAQVWRTYRDITRDMLLARSFSEQSSEDWRAIEKRYPPELVERAFRLPSEKEEQGEIYDPLDLIWIVHTEVVLLDRARDYLLRRPSRRRYVICANPDCECFVTPPGPDKRGPLPRYCDHCKGKVRNLIGHHERKRTHDDVCREILWKAFKSLSSSERKFASQRERMALARRLHKKIRKQMEKVPGVRGERWIAKQLKREEFNGQKQ